MERLQGASVSLAIRPPVPLHPVAEWPKSGHMRVSAGSKPASRVNAPEMPQFMAYKNET